MKELVASLDCGTTSTRFIVFDADAQVVASHQLEFPQYFPHPGWHDHDPLEILYTSIECIRATVRKLPADHVVRAMGITNQRETTVAWSRRTGLPLTRAIVWCDARNRNTVEHYNSVLEHEGIDVGATPDASPPLKGADARAWIRATTGLGLSTYFSATKLRWMLDHCPDIARAHEEDDLCVGTVESWLVYNLTAKKLHVTDVSNASRTLLLDFRGGGSNVTPESAPQNIPGAVRQPHWSPPLLRFFGIRESCLPRVVSSSEVLGTLHLDPSLGLPDCRIAGLVGDQQSSLVGHKCLQRGDAKCTYGTGAFMLICTGTEPSVPDDRTVNTIAYQAGPEAPPIYALEGSIAVAGSAIKWLRDSMRLISTSDEVNTLAAQEQDTGGVYFVTAFNGLLAPYWDPRAAGLLVGMSQYTNPAHIARATLEASAFQTHALVESMGVQVTELKVDGGMTNGELAMQVLADVGGFTVVRPEMREMTALGAALLAGSAIKLFGWDISRPETLNNVNTKGNTYFRPTTSLAHRQKMWRGWKRAVSRSLRWQTDEEDGECEP
ncbi:glycerol kinase [Fistulina hepatica ATCC 64428]|uniref:glycerol kinase n=1 Tax=Fistulina hepatica ATCC 64428 TaxID=1128425 RepID=A0A0D7A117_9AGAR|nr:glycerol kinase [Fistulina hepatica ATCC 64428]